MLGAIRAWGSGLGARGSGLGARGYLGSGLAGLGALGSGLGARGPGLGARGSGLAARGSGRGAQGLGFGARTRGGLGAWGLGWPHATRMQHTCNTHATHMQHSMQHSQFVLFFCRKCASAIKIFFNEIKSFESCSMPLCTSLPKMVKIQDVACVLHVCCMRVACVLHACCMWPTQAPSPEP